MKSLGASAKGRGRGFVNVDEWNGDWSADDIASLTSKSSGEGFYNQGNTCYVNATVQALFGLPSLLNDLRLPKLSQLPRLEKKQYGTHYTHRTSPSHRGTLMREIGRAHV